MKKRFFSALLSLALLLSMVPAAGASGETQISLDVNKTSVTEGDRVTVEVEIENNPGFDALQINVHYDEDVLTCTGITPGKVLSQDGILYDGNASNDSMATFVAIRLAPIQEDGVLVKLTFEADDTGTCPLSLEIVSFECGGTKFDAKLDSAKVKVSAAQSEPAEPEEPEEEEQPAVKPESPAQTTTVSFTDVPKTHWAYSYVQSAVGQGLFAGISADKFGPDITVTRGMFVTVLYSYAGSPKVDAPTFDDVPANAWYAKAAAWAAQEGIVSGIGGNNFGPDLPITREQLALILYQYAGGTSPGTELLVRMFYPDGSDIHSWALTAISWAVNEGLISGKSGNLLAPLDTATRAEVAVIMQNFVDLSK